MWPHRRQPTRLPRPWDSPGKNTGVGCHFLFQCRKVKSESEVDQSCPTLPMDCSPPGSSVCGIFQARVLEWGAIAFSDWEVRWLDQSHRPCCVVLGRSVMSDSSQPHGLSPSRLLCPWGFSRQEDWSGLPCPPPGDLPDPRIKPRSPELQADSLPSEPPGKPKNIGLGSRSPF